MLTLFGAPVKLMSDRASCCKCYPNHQKVTPDRSFRTLIRVRWAPSGSLLKFPLYDFNDYDDDWARF